MLEYLVILYYIALHRKHVIVQKLKSVCEVDYKIILE